MQYAAILASTTLCVFISIKKYRSPSVIPKHILRPHGVIKMMDVDKIFILDVPQVGIYH